MCGIAGFVSRARLDEHALARGTHMRDVLTHRGPDGAGIHADAHAVLAHRRLSIVDLVSGAQPLANEASNVWITFNGEIYNHATVRRELESRGHVYRTKSDTETIVHAYEEWGDACVDRLRGMFAFGIWDEGRRRLLLGRDRLGIKPLYWTRAGDVLIFGSEIKAVLASGLVSAEVDRARIPELLATRYISGEQTLFKGVRKLLPGHVLVFEDGNVSIRKYWDLEGRPKGLHYIRRSAGLQACDDTTDVAAEFRARLTDCVRSHLMSDVPLGMFLSGGIDSSAIAALMAPMMERPLETFSVAFKERAFNELEYARTVARAVHANAHEVVIDDADFFGALPSLIWHEDEPIAHPSSVPLFFVSRLARRHVAVVLTGEGSDELLAGYGKYPRAAWNWTAGTIYERMLPRAVRTAVASWLVPAVPGRVGRYARRSFLAMDRSPESMFFDNFASIGLREQRRLLSEAVREDVTPANAYGGSMSSFLRLPDESTLLDRLLYTDITTYLVELLMKQDQMSMAASIESRVPFLDHELVEFAWSLPDSWKLSGLTTKRVLREAMTGVLPDSILQRPKMGFPVPFASWTRRGWNGVVREVLLDRRSRERGLIDPAAVEQLLAAHAAGAIDAGDRIWSLLNLELWHRTFVDGEGVQALSGAEQAPPLRRRVAPPTSQVA